MSSNSPFFGHQDLDKYNIASHSVFNSLIESRVKNENLHKSGLSDIYLSITPGDYPSFIKTPSLNASGTLLKKNYLMPSGEIDNSIKNSWNDTFNFQQNPRFCFTSMPDHILIDEEKSGGKDEDLNIQVEDRIDSLNPKECFDFSNTIVNRSKVSPQNQMKINTKDSLHESLVVPHLNKHHYDKEKEYLGDIYDPEKKLYSADKLEKVLSHNSVRSPQAKFMFSFVRSSKESSAKNSQGESDKGSPSESSANGDTLMKFLLSFFTNKTITDKDCNFSEKERKILKSLITRKFEYSIPSK